MQLSYTPFHVLAASVGLGVMIVDVSTNVDFMHGQTGTLWDTSIAAVVAVAVGTALALSATYRAFRDWRPLLMLFLLAGFILGAGFSLTATLDRVATLRDQTLAKAWDADPELRQLRAERSITRQEANVECSVQRGGRGLKCEKAEDQLRAVTARVKAREDELNPLGKRIAALVPGITVEQASVFQPMLLPVALFVLGNWLFAFGMAGTRNRPEFGTKLSRRDELEARAQRFALAFQAAHGRPPRITEVKDNLGVSHTVAKRLTERVIAE